MNLRRTFRLSKGVLRKDFVHLVGMLTLGVGFLCRGLELVERFHSPQTLTNGF